MIVLNQQVQKTKKSQFPSSIHQPDFKKNITGWVNSQEASTQKPFQGIFFRTKYHLKRFHPAISCQAGKRNNKDEWFINRKVQKFALCL